MPSARPRNVAVVAADRGPLRGRFLRALALVASLAAAACGAGADDAASSEDAVVAKSTALEDRDFRGALDRSFIRATQSNLGDDVFAAKWDASRESGVIFMRSYPGAYHADLAGVAVKRILGEEGICLGDAHPDNFGFLHLDGRTTFAFNDLDDSGICAIGVDAARYFAVLRLYFDDAELTREVLEQYVDTVKDPRRAEAIDEGLLPKWDKVESKGLAEATAGNRFLLEGDVGAPSAADRAAVLALARADARLSRFTIDDVASVGRTAGGSGGLRRFWLLASDGSRRTILELKEAATPGVELGRASHALSATERLDTLKRELWSTAAPSDYFYVSLGGARFLVRDRLAKKSIKLLELSRKDLRNVLRTQASVMARVHGAHWAGVDKDRLRKWLSGTSETLAERWQDTYDAGR
jgi:uncharacterized protein (DUF2252 family)